MKARPVPPPPKAGKLTGVATVRQPTSSTSKPGAGAIKNITPTKSTPTRSGGKR